MNNPDIWNKIRRSKPKVDIKIIREITERIAKPEPLPDSFKRRILK